MTEKAAENVDPDVIGDYYDKLPERPFTGSEAMEEDFVKQVVAPTL